MDPFSTHIAPLVAALLATRGPILELGGGWYSTPILSAFSRAQHRLVCTVETDADFCRTLEPFGSEMHAIRVLEGYDFSLGIKFSTLPDTVRAEHIENQLRFLTSLDDDYSERWSVVFVDQRPGFLRTPSIEHYMHKAEFLVVHDTEHPAYQYEPALSKFKYRSDFRLRIPATTIVSNFHPCDYFSFPESECSPPP